MKGNITLVLGDFNAKVGRESYNHAIIGKHNLHEESNENGLKLTSFVAGKPSCKKHEVPTKG